MRTILVICLLGIMVLFLFACSSNFEQPTSSQSKKGSMISDQLIENNEQKVPSESTKKINPPEKLEFSDDLKNYAYKYCNMEEKDFDLNVSKIRRQSENTTTYSNDTGIQRFEKQEINSDVTVIDEKYISNVLKKLPLTNLDSSITIGITTRTESGFKDFSCFVNNGQPIVKSQSYDADTTKVILTIPYETMLELGQTTSNNICSKFKSEISNTNIGYDLNFNIMDSIKKGVSELKSCLS